MIFVDTSAWFATFVVADRHNAAATSWFSQNTIPLVTTDYIVDELLTLLQARREYSMALQLGTLLFNEALAKLEWISEADVRAAWSVFEKYQDKGWSFTDCTSRVVMERLGITQAFAFDEHFGQFGTVGVLP